MVRPTKTDKQTAPAAPTTSAKTENVVIEAASAKKAAAPKKAKDAAPVAAAAPAAAPVAAAAAPAAALSNEVVESADPSSISTKMTEFSAKLQQMYSIFSSVKGDFKTLEKAIAREMKAAQKSSAKKSKRSGNRQPSGFVKPTLISAELASFLGKTVGTEMARTAVSKEINNYIRSNSLQDKANGRKINPDAKLATLLKTKPEDELTYFNLQRFMKHHFIKADAPVASATV